jgi:hypothetical protein
MKLPGVESILKILSRDEVNIDGSWIDDQIYCIPWYSAW